MRMTTIVLSLFLLGIIAFIGINKGSLAETIVPTRDRSDDLMDKKPDNFPTAIFAGGCFWCVESEFRGINGVLFTRSGYTGGHVDNPKYEDTHDSQSGHAEAVEVTYDPQQVTYKVLVEFFLVKAHDPTQLNRQGADTGTQYRSAIFYQDEEQKKIAQDLITEVNARKIYSSPIVTTLEPFKKFWEAEDYHQQFYEKYEQKYGQPHINDWIKRQSKT